MQGIQIAIAVLGVCMVAIIGTVLGVRHSMEMYSEMLAELALHFTEYKDWADKTLERLDKRIEDNATGLKALNEAHCTMQKKFEEIDDLTAESLKAQIDADKAWADGVRALSSYGANIPSIKPGGLNNE